METVCRQASHRILCVLQHRNFLKWVCRIKCTLTVSPVELLVQPKAAGKLCPDARVLVDHDDIVQVPPRAPSLSIMANVDLRQLSDILCLQFEHRLLPPLEEHLCRLSSFSMNQRALVQGVYHAPALLAVQNDVNILVSSRERNVGRKDLDLVGAQIALGQWLRLVGLHVLLPRRSLSWGVVRRFAEQELE